MVKVKEYVVTAPYVTVSCKDNLGGMQVLGFYQGGVLPESADPVSLKSLVDKGMVSEAGSEDAELIYGGGPTLKEMKQLKADEVAAEDAKKAVKSKVAKAADDKADVEVVNGRPKATASKEDWVAYAVSQRVAFTTEEDARADAEAKSKAELIAEFGS